MTTPTQKFQPSEISSLLRGETETLSAWSEKLVAQRLIWQVAVIVLGAGFYGAAMGWWRAPEQALFVAVKFPLIILLVVIGNALINGMMAPLLGLNIPFRQSFSAILMSYAVASTILGAFSPIIAFLVWNAPDMTAKDSSETAYNIILLTHVAVIALAGTMGNARLFQLLRQLAGDRTTAVRVLCAWLAGNFFLGSQLTYIFRPFIGSPRLPVGFLRVDALHGNFYETVFQSLKHIFIH